MCGWCDTAQETPEMTELLERLGRVSNSLAIHKKNLVYLPGHFEGFFDEMVPEVACDIERTTAKMTGDMSDLPEQIRSLAIDLLTRKLEQLKGFRSGTPSTEQYYEVWWSMPAGSTDQQAEELVNKLVPIVGESVHYLRVPPQPMDNETPCVVLPLLFED